LKIKQNHEDEMKKVISVEVNKNLIVESIKNNSHESEHIIYPTKDIILHKPILPTLQNENVNKLRPIIRFKGENIK